MSDPRWHIEYDNDTGPNDDSFVQWWKVTDGTRLFDAHSDEDAEWLCGVLNRTEP